MAKVNASGALVYCGYIGGSGDEKGHGVAVDSSGNAYVVGETSSTEATFPVTGGPDLTFNGATDAFVAKINVVTTAVELLSFEASPLDSAVELRWETGSELNNLGFHLYRSLSAEGPYERITSAVIPGLGSSPVGASYSYVDGGLANGTTYYYELEDIETTGKTKLHGPVWAAPQAFSPSGGGAGGSSSGDVGSGSSGGLSTTKTAYGDPTSVSLRVLETDEHHALLELRTGGFYAVRQADGSVRLEIPGMEEVLDPGLPGLPVKRAFVEAVVGRGVRLGGVVSRDVLSFPDLMPALSGRAEMVQGEEGVVRARVRRALVARPLEPGLFPVTAAQLLGTAFQQETKKALVELWPLRWDSSSNRLELARRLVVRLEFAGKEEGESPRGGTSRGRRVPARLGRSADELLAQLVVRQTGLYAVRFEELFPSRRRSLQVSELRLSRQAEHVPFHLEPDGSSFGPGSLLYFFSEGPSLNPFGNEAVYELSLARTRSGGVTMPLVSASPSGSASSFAWSVKKWEENKTYQPGLLEAPDLWLWDILVAPVKKGYHFALESLVSTSEPSQLTVFLQGGSDQEGVADHHVRVSINGSPVGEATWDGQTPQAIPASIDPGILHQGDNLLELENLGDAGASYSLVFLDRFELVSPRSLSAPDGLFEASFSLSGSAEVSGLGASSLLLDITSPATPSWIFGASPTQAGIAFRTEAERQYLALSPQNLLHPQVRLPLQSSLRSTHNRADYILLAPQAFLAAAQPLLDLRQRQGLAVKAVALEQVYQDFGHGEATPQAIRDFIAYAYHFWQSPSPRYVLLLGDASYDYKDFLHTGVVNRVPPLLVKTSFLWTASDTAYAAVNGEDLLPDLALGRLPAASVSEAEALVEKVIAFESSGLTLSAGPAVLVADNPDVAGDFEQSARQAAPLLAPT
ncbi:MAG TPA: C25 family cysteine peptidase, partial [Vicinamibacteria bacterium]